jgi:hypothetical protein
MSSQSLQPLDLGPEDAAVIIRSDGTIESTWPDIADGGDVPEHILTAAAVMFALQDPKMYDHLHEYFLEQCHSIRFESEPANDG